MKLIRANISNFRGIGTETSIDYGLFNILVGQNDAGKSTFLKALDLFFNDEGKSQDISNLSSDDDNVTIEMIFMPNKQKLIIDEEIQTTFEDEEIVDSDGHLRVKKCWDISKKQLSQIYSLLEKNMRRMIF